jgi:hypothetical protein
MQKSPGTTWTLPEVFDGFLEQFCQVSVAFASFAELKCGQYGPILLWASVPPRRLCFRCSRTLNFVYQSVGVSHFGLSLSDVSTIPFFKIARSDRPEFKVLEIKIVLLESLRSLAASRNQTELDGLPEPMSFSLTSPLSLPNWTFHYPGRIVTGYHPIYHLF